MRVRTGVIALLCAGTLATGCSSTGSDSALSAAAAASLHSDVLALTRAAAARNWSAADGALSQLRADLAEAVAVKSVSAARAAEIEATIKAVTTDLAVSSGRTATSSAAPSSTSNASTPKPATHSTSKAAPPPPPGDGGKSHGRKHKGG